MREYAMLFFGVACAFLAIEYVVAGIHLEELEEEFWGILDTECGDISEEELPVSLKDTALLRIDEFTERGIRSVPIYPDAAKSVISSKYFDPKLRTVIYVHGFTGCPSDFFGQSFATAYKMHGGYNILALDSSNLIDIRYCRSAKLVKYIGETFGFFLHNLTRYGVNVEDIHLVGHSLGAHISGFAGKTFKTLVPYVKLPRISGLDPAGPQFSHRGPAKRLDKGDAEFVDIIHTNMGCIGINESIGHVDFYVNGGGTVQPGCLESICSHLRSLFVFEESVNHNYNFIGALCKSKEDFDDGNCLHNERAVMGYATPNITRGTFYLWTAGIPLFGVGLIGADPPLHFNDTMY